MLVSFVHDPEFLSKSIETVLQYKHELLNIHSSFLCMAKEGNQIELFIITVKGSGSGLESPIFVLLYFQQAIEKFVQPFILDLFTLSVQNINQGIQFMSEDQSDIFYHSALLYKQNQWHFRL